MQSQEIKRILTDLGADLCGIASIDRFGGAPEGFHPCDVMPSCQSVVAFAKRFPAGTLACNTNVPYTIVRNKLSDMIDTLSVQFCAVMEQHGIAAAPTGAISHSHYDARTGRGRSIVSAKHCAQAAGLGRIGKNTLLITPQYGNMVWLGVALTDAQLEPDPLLEGDVCGNCTLCIDSCPAHALGDPAMNQSACLGHAFRTPEGQEFTIQCHTCRSICPHCLGSENGRG